MDVVKKRKNKEYFLVIGIAIISCIFVFLTTDKYFYGDDLSYHLNRIIGIVDAFKDGQMIPKVYPNINYGFGYGSPFFYCDLFIYPFALLNLLRVPVFTIFKIIIVFYSCLAAFTAYFFANKVFNKPSSKVLFVFLYMLSSYRLYDVYNRAALGEMIAISFVPLVLYSIYQVLYLKEDNYVLLAISFSSLVLSHLISAVLLSFIFLIFIIFFIIVNIKQGKTIIKVGLTVLKGTILAVLLCSWFLLPMIEQIQSQQFYCFSFESTFGAYPRVESLVNSLSLINGKNCFDISLFMLSFLYLFSKKNKIITLLFIISIFLFLVMVGIIPLTHHISFIQFMFRLNILIYPFLVIIVTYIYENNNIKILKVLYLIFAILFIFNSSHRIINLFTDLDRYIQINNLDYKLSYDPDQFYFNRAQLAGGEYLPVCDNMDYLNGEKNIILEDIQGNYLDTLKDYTKINTHIDFDYEGEAEFVSVPLTYYKGYVCFCDGEEIDCINDELYKKVGFYLSEGKHHYSVHYGGTKIQRNSLIISFLSILFVLFKYVYNKRIKKKRDLV